MNILVIRFSALGDLVTLEPTFRAFRYFFSKAHITFLTSSIGKDIYQDTGYFDDFVVHKTFTNTLSVLHSKHFDIVFNLQCNKPSHYLNLFLHQNITINKSYNLWQKLLHIKTHSKNIEEMLLAAKCDTTLIQKYFEDPEKYLIQFPTKRTQDVSKQIALSTGSSLRWQSKKWGIDKYKQLVDMLIQKGFTITLIGSKLEEEDAKAITEAFPNVINYVNKTSLNQLKTILANVKLYIGNDSGPTHIAASVGTDTLTIFGPTDIQHSPKFGNYRGEHSYVKPQASIICHPCYKGTCPKHHECMQSIEVNEVFNLATEHFKERV